MSTQKHSALAVSAFVISLLAFVALLVLIGIASFIEQSTPVGVVEGSVDAVVLGFLLLLFLGLSAVSWLLGFVALLQKPYKKLLAILALVFSSLALLITLGLLAVGLMQV